MQFKAKLRAMVFALPLSMTAGVAGAADVYGDDIDSVALERPAAVAVPPSYDWRLFPTISDNGRPILSPEGVSMAAREQGWSDIERVYYTGGVYTAVGRAPNGVDWNLRIDATTGLVLRPHRHHHHGLYGPKDAAVILEEPVPVPRTRTRVGRYVDPTYTRAGERELLTFARVRGGLEDLGYSDCTEVGYEEGIFRVQGKNRGGDLVRLVVDAYTGEVINERAVPNFDDPWTEDPYPVRFDTVRRRLLRQDYRDIEGIRSDGDILVLRAEDRHGEEVRLTVDARTGRVIDSDYID
jgi:uncharacterized membrane protein YkoI